MTQWDTFLGPNAGYVQELYERYRDNPQSVDTATRSFFDRMGAPPAIALNGAQLAPASAPAVDVQKVVLAARLARAFREYGHLAAQIDPLGHPGPGDPMIDPATHGLTDEDMRRLPPSIVWPDAGPEAGTCLDAMRRLQAIYSGTTGYEFDHVEDYNERIWLHGVVEAGTYRPALSAEDKRDLLVRLTEVERFEQFLHRVFVGQKRFSIEGNDMLVPMLDELVASAAEAGIREVLIGMAHRGRLNVRTHILGKPYESIFAEFQAATTRERPLPEGSTDIYDGWSGDVKYHLGASRTVGEQARGAVLVTLADNPSHLEFINPVIEGFARAAQDDRSHPGPPRQDVDRSMAVTIHGDAAFPGEGVVAETLNLSRLAGYETGGSIHLIANNQIGFTTNPRDARSTLYASDLAKGFEIPIVHVNGDDPEACLAAIRLAHAYRQRFHKDFLIDLVGYRRWGHNEGDEPSFTQPQMYAEINAHPTVRDIYARQLIDQAVITPQEDETIQREVMERLQQARDSVTAGRATAERRQLERRVVEPPETAVPEDELRQLNQAIFTMPESFQSHPKLERQLARRLKALDEERSIDWAQAETLAFASILADGQPIRLTGQDAERGTFSQRHLVLHSPAGGRYVPLQSLPQAKASFAVYNSPLSEAAPLGFEYGYTVHAPEALVVWEAQYGDFANAGQVLIDQFIVAAAAKWRQQPALVLLLPHGYEGGGPEHSSARLERYLQMAAEQNLRICNCTTAAQYFHLLRQQAALLQSDRRPLVLMSPKSLLRHPAAASGLRDLATGRFQPVLDDANAQERRENVERLVLCSGKIYVELMAAAKDRPEDLDRTAVIRIEQLYPFPQQELIEVLNRYRNAQELVWLQEEPQNMGAWLYLIPKLRALLPDGVPLRYVGRPERASTAEGSSDAHALEQKRLLSEALGSERRAHIESRGMQHVS